ncbi:MAG: [FeFe] hydrogenase H-cluster radical SAM maturase HydE [Melioribacteraceae bacterium]|nr:[FeFe] hydrogenase H-cluster radical SAM maturase HydE [Melioribacteraceae bacterium]
MDLKELLNKEGDYTRDEIISLLNSEDIDSLIEKANEIRDFYFGETVHLRGIVEFSNYCSENCIYCSYREDNLIIPRYRMSADEIINAAKTIYDNGIHTVVLQSGSDNYYDTDLISYLIYYIKREFDVAVTLSIGERSFEEYKAWKIAGADRYIMKHESANPKTYSIYHRKNQLFERINHLKYLKHIGYQVGSGNIIGLPLQTIEDIADDILLCRELDVDMAAFTPFIPAPNTPYQNMQKVPDEFVMKVIAVVRIVLKNIYISSSSIFERNNIKSREKGLLAGANVILPDFTPSPYRDYFKHYINSGGLIEDPLSSHKIIKDRIEALGKTIASTKGHSIKTQSNR